MSKQKKATKQPKASTVADSAKARFIESSKTMKLTLNDIQEVFNNLLTNNNYVAFGETIIQTANVKIIPREMLQQKK